MRVVCEGWVSAHGYFFGNLASADEVYGICLLHYLEKKTADHADAVYRPPRPVAVAHLRSRPAAAAALWSHKKMGNTFWQRQSGCGSSSPLGESDALPCLRGLCSFPHLSKAYNTFILNLSETLNACSFSRLSLAFVLFYLFAFLPRGAKQLKA